jgi:hypothetical protein
MRDSNSQIGYRSMIRKKMAIDCSSVCAGEAFNFSAVAQHRLVLRVAIVCLTVSFGTQVLGETGGQAGVGLGRWRNYAGAAIITAKPEHMTVTSGRGSAAIQRETGNRSIGFVVGTEHPASWQGLVRWLLILAVAAVLYIAVYLSSTGTLRTTFPTEPTTSPRPLHVGRNLFLGIAAFVCIDGIFFHTGLYTSIVAPASYAGRVAVLTRAEKERPASGLKEVLVLGDSRMAEGFSVKAADEFGSGAGLKFVSLAEPAASMSAWYYMLREVDPTARRYRAIVVPYGVGYEPSTADALRISMVASLLRYGDCLSFASGFQRWSGRFRAFTACILRGLAYQSDVVDFLEHPFARRNQIQQALKGIRSRAGYKGRDYDMVGTSYDPKTGKITFSPRLTQAQREAIRKSFIQPSLSETEYFVKLQRYWIPRILNRYLKSPTAIVLTPVPRGPFGELAGLSMAEFAVFPGVIDQRTVLSLPEQTFDFLEKPEYFFDGYHLNAKGRQKFTEKLVTELMGRLGSGGSHADASSRSEAVTDQSLLRHPQLQHSQCRR